MLLKSGISSGHDGTIADNEPGTTGEEDGTTDGKTDGEGTSGGSNGSSGSNENQNPSETNPEPDNGSTPGGGGFDSGD